VQLQELKGDIDPVALHSPHVPSNAKRPRLQLAPSCSSELYKGLRSDVASDIEQRSDTVRLVHGHFKAPQKHYSATGQTPEQQADEGRLQATEDGSVNAVAGANHRWEADASAAVREWIHNIGQGSRGTIQGAQLRETEVRRCSLGTRRASPSAMTQPAAPLAWHEAAHLAAMQNVLPHGQDRSPREGHKRIAHAQPGEGSDEEDVREEKGLDSLHESAMSALSLVAQRRKQLHERRMARLRKSILVHERASGIMEHGADAHTRLTAIAASARPPESACTLSMPQALTQQVGCGRSIVSPHISTREEGAAAIVRSLLAMCTVQGRPSANAAVHSGMAPVVSAAAEESEHDATLRRSSMTAKQAPHE
jgi:hypothetical protein